MTTRDEDIADIVDRGCPHCRNLVTTLLRNELITGKPILKIDLELQVHKDSMEMIGRSAEPGGEFGTPVLRVKIPVSRPLLEGDTIKFVGTEFYTYVKIEITP